MYICLIFTRNQTLISGHWKSDTYRPVLCNITASYPKKRRKCQTAHLPVMFSVKINHFNKLFLFLAFMLWFSLPVAALWLWSQVFLRWFIHLFIQVASVAAGWPCQPCCRQSSGTEIIAQMMAWASLVCGLCCKKDTDRFGGSTGSLIETRSQILCSHWSHRQPFCAVSACVCVCV